MLFFSSFLPPFFYLLFPNRVPILVFHSFNTGCRPYNLRTHCPPTTLTITRMPLSFHVSILLYPSPSPNGTRRVHPMQLDTLFIGTAPPPHPFAPAFLTVHYSPSHSILSLALALDNPSSVFSLSDFLNQPSLSRSLHSVSFYFFTMTMCSKNLPPLPPKQKILLLRGILLLCNIPFVGHSSPIRSALPPNGWTTNNITEIKFPFSPGSTQLFFFFAPRLPGYTVTSFIHSTPNSSHSFEI
jgi:hypothetical protein